MNLTMQTLRTIDGLTLARFTLAGDDEWECYGLCRVSEDGTVSPVCRHEHRTEGDAIHCRNAEVARGEIAAEAARKRCAALPAPEGARFLSHCGGYWPASVGGACPTCGAAGERLVPSVEVEDVRGRRWTWVRTSQVHAHHALSDAGRVPGDGARQVSDESAVIEWGKAESPGRVIADALAAKGWAVKTKGIARKRWTQPGLFDALAGASDATPTAATTPKRTRTKKTDAAA